MSSPTKLAPWTIAVTAIAIFMVSLDNLVVTNALASIRVDLGASIEALEWTVNAYTLAFAVFLLTGAALGDRFGRRRARALERRADRRARRAGHRRRHRRPALLDAAQRGDPGIQARPGARHL